ncbi:MAG: hypothetical protein AMJ60_10775, partial [Desulfobacterales bacterium SG8_35]
QDTLPEDAVIYGIKPSIISLYSKRLAFLPPAEITAGDFLPDIEKNYLPQYFYMVAITSPSISTPFFPLEKIRDDLEILHTARTHDGENAPVVAILARIKH